MTPGLRHAIAMPLLLALTACGHMTPMTAAMRDAGAIAARADVPDIAKQIQAALVGTDANGTHVRKLPTPGVTKAATFMTYKAFDNNLSWTLPAHMNVLERVGSNTGVNVLSLADGSGPNDTVEYYVRQDADPKTVTSPYTPVGREGELDTGNPASLARAVRWAATSYPSRFRWVDVNDHGGGYYGICQDDQTNSIIRLPELAQALGASGKIDMLSFDACLMASVEVGYELRNVARVMVASEDASFPLGMNYDVTLNSLSNGKVPDAAALGREMVLRASRTGADPDVVNVDPTDPNAQKVTSLETISAIDLAQIDKVRVAVDHLAQALLAALPTQRQAIMMSLGAVKPFHVAGPDKTDFNHRDLHEVVVQLGERVTDKGVQAACQAVRATLFNRGGAVIMSRAVRAEAKVPRGLSIYLPLDGHVDPIYTKTAFARDTRWDEFLAQLHP